MSILIKGMEMPDDCEHCPMYGTEQTSGCFVTKYYCLRRHGVNRPDWCPLVEVPTPHGRLIDADALEDSENCRGERIYYADDVDDAPTVIEAEE